MSPLVDIITQNKWNWTSMLIVKFQKNIPKKVYIRKLTSCVNIRSQHYKSLFWTVWSQLEHIEWNWSLFCRSMQERSCVSGVWHFIKTIPLLCAMKEYHGAGDISIIDMEEFSSSLSLAISIWTPQKINCSPNGDLDSRNFIGLPPRSCRQSYIKVMRWWLIDEIRGKTILFST